MLDVTEAHLIDHTFMEYIHHIEEDQIHSGGSVVAVGFDRFKSFSNHPMAARKFSPENQSKIEFKLSPRQLELRNFAEREEFAFYPQRVKSALKYKDFPIQKGNRILFEENVQSKYFEFGKVDVSDITLTEGVRQDREDTHVTVVHLSETEFQIPDFALEPEGLWSKFSELVGGKDIDFPDHPAFSQKYYLRGENEEAIRQFFTEPLLNFLENREEMHVECHKNKLLFYKKRDLLEASEIEYAIRFAEDFLEVNNKAVLAS